MHIISNIGTILLAVWLLVWGITRALSVGHPVVTVLLGVLAVVTAAFLIMGR